MVLAEDLRKAVLQSALQGNLTEQLPTDSSVGELLDTIKKEQEQLIKIKKIKKEKALPSIEDDDKPFEIPDNWKWVYLGNIFMHNAGKALNIKNTKGELREYITTSNVYEDHFELDNLKKMYYTDEEVERYSIKKNDLLVLEGGDVGRTAIWDLEMSYCIQNHIHKLRPYVSTINIKLYFYILNYFKKTGLLKGKGIAIQGLSSNALHRVLIPLPPIEEQQRIVERLDVLMKEIDEYEVMEKQLKETKKHFPYNMKNSVLQYAFQGKLTKQQKEDSSVDEWLLQISDEIKAFKWKAKKVIDIEDILDILGNPDIPDTWRWVRLSDIAVSNIGLTYKPENITSDGTIVLRSSNIQNGKMDYNDIVRVNMDIPENKMCNIGDILMCSRNGSKSLVGKVAIIDNVGMSFGAFMAIIRSRCNKYLYYFFNSQLFKKQMNPNSSTETINQITQDMLFNCIIPLPPIEEQERIVKKLEQILPLIEELK